MPVAAERQVLPDRVRFSEGLIQQACEHAYQETRQGAEKGDRLTPIPQCSASQMALHTVRAEPVEARAEVVETMNPSTSSG